MTKKEKTFELIDRSLKNIAIGARLSVDSGECEWSEIEEMISERGNKYINEFKVMSKSDFIRESLMSMLENMKSNEKIQNTEK